MSQENDQQSTLEPGGGDAGGKGDQAAGAKQRAETRYRILWGAMPDPEAEREEGEPEPRPKYREILNPREGDGAYVATSAETARRRAFNDEESAQYPFIQRALKSHGLVLKHVALSSWGDDVEDLAEPLKIATREELTGRI